MTGSVAGVGRQGYYNPRTSREPEIGTHSYRQKHGTWYPSPGSQGKRNRGGGGATATETGGDKPWAKMGPKRSRSVFAFQRPQPQLLLSETEEGLINTLGAPIT